MHREVYALRSAFSCASCVSIPGRTDRSLANVDTPRLLKRLLSQLTKVLRSGSADGGNRPDGRVCRGRPRRCSVVVVCEGGGVGEGPVAAQGHKRVWRVHGDHGLSATSLDTGLDNLAFGFGPNRTGTGPKPRPPKKNVRNPDSPTSKKTKNMETK